MKRLLLFALLVLSLLPLGVAQEELTNPTHDFLVDYGKSFEAIIDEGAQFRIRMYETSEFVFTLHDVTSRLLIDSISTEKIHVRLKVGSRKFENIVLPLNENTKLDIYGKDYFDMVVQPYLVHKGNESQDRNVVLLMWTLQNFYVDPEMREEFIKNIQGSGEEISENSYMKYYILGVLVLVILFLYIIFKRGGSSFAQEKVAEPQVKARKKK